MALPVLTPKINALTAYANEITGESDTTLSEAVHTLGSGYGGGSGGVSDGYAITALDADDFPTAVDHYGTKVHRQQYWNRTATDGFWRNLESITFKNTVTSIGNYGFAYCSKITSLDVSSVTEIGANALQNCTRLSTLALPVLTTIGASAFISCTSLTSLVMPLVKSYPAIAMRGCTGLQTVQMGSVGNAVTSIASTAFQNVTQSGLTITVYTTGAKVSGLLANIKSNTGATNATVIFKASENTTYNDVSYSAGDTILTSTP